jgi:hypothetical protein
MEIKLVCACGTKFKFDVEPVNGRMPAHVSCPGCGADATAEANEVIRQALPTPPEPADVPVGVPAGGGLRINRPAPAYEPPPPPVYAPAPAPSFHSEPKSKKRLATILTAVAAIAVIAFGGWKFGTKWYKRIKTVVDIASVIKELSDTNVPPSNFWYEDSVVVFVRHTNHLEVAEACKTYWKEKLHKNLTVSESGEREKAGEYDLIPAHNGYVRIIGEVEWPAAQFEGLSQYLSQKFDTLVFELQEVDFSGAYHFGVYEKGARKFHARMDVKMVKNEPEEKVTVENKEWAIANGYKPGENGFDDFYLDDADEITQRLGMKLWDEPDGTEITGLVMKETR